MRLSLCYAFFYLIVFSLPAYAVTIEDVTGPKSGVTAWLVEDHKLPVVSLRLAFRGGSEQDPAARQGLANLTADALTEGAGPYDAATFQQRLADRSISLGFAAGRDQIAGNLKCLSADCDAAFDMLRLALTQPRFDAADIERLRAEQSAAIRQQFADPAWQGRYALFTRIFPDHPYGQRRLGSLASLAAITRDDMAGFAATHFARDNLIVAVAGDMTPDQLAKALDDSFAGLPAKAQLTPVPDAPTVAGGKTILVTRAGTQTDLVFALAGPKRDATDWYAAEIANYILGGGGFSSRLMQDVRDKKGLTYGIDTELAPADHAGLIMGQASVDNPKMAEALATIVATMKNFRDQVPAAADIKAAKDYLTGSQPLGLTSTDKIAQKLVVMQFDHLGRDYLDRYAAIIDGVTAQDVADAIRRWFDPAAVTWVMVGEPQGVAVDETRMPVRQ